MYLMRNKVLKSQKFPIFKWSEAQGNHIRKYGNSSAAHLDEIHVPESFTCTNTNCSDKLHRSDIDQLFDDICVVVV